MNFLSGLLGNASQIPTEKAQADYAKLLSPNERIEAAYQLVRDVFFFTGQRFVHIDVQGLTGKKIAYHSIPYKSVVRFAVQTAGHFDLNAELVLWIRSRAEPLVLEFTNKVNIYEVQALLASHVAQ
jgi:hypothetical protein